MLKPITSVKVSSLRLQLVSIQSAMNHQTHFSGAGTSLTGRGIAKWTRVQSLCRALLIQIFYVTVQIYLKV